MANISKSILQLQEHQEDAYKNVERLFENDRYAAVIFPTGCGKSFVTLKYIQEHPDEKVLFLSPRCAINEQMYEYVVRQIGGITDSKEKIQEEFGSMEKAAQNFIPGIKALTYQSLLDLGKNDSSMKKIFEQSKPDLIVIDEMHHIKTKNNKSKNAIEEDENELVEAEQLELQKEQNKWGNCFNKLLSICPNSKVLGLSATPIRADGANVVERIFENSIASEISLLEAMETGLLNPPQYVVPDFIKKEELQSLLEQIEQADDTRKIQLKQEYDKLVEYSEKALGIPELMDEHITQRNGKYIIFCKDVNDMAEKQSKAKEWFSKIDEDLKIYRVSSKHSDSQKQIDDFNADNSEHLKVMYCVGMLDEGVHLNDISGVILTSKTESRPTYLQRLGRVLSIDQTSKSLVIDLVNNNEILQMDSYYQKGYQITDIESLSEAIDWVNEKNDGNLPDYENAKNNKEKIMARRLNRINNKYYKYFSNEELLNNLDNETKTTINDILALGKNINLWDNYIQLQTDEESKNADVNEFLKSIEIKGIRKDLKTMLEQVNIGTSLKNALAIQNWCKDNFGDKEIWNKRLPYASSENAEEKRLGAALSGLRIKFKKYDGIDIENIDNLEDKKTAKIIKDLDQEYNLNIHLKNALAIQNWCEQNFGDKEIWNKRLPSTNSENEEEQKLATALRRLKQGFKKYDGIDLVEIDNEEDKKIVQIIRNLDNEYGLSISLKNTLEIQNWCQQNFGDKEIWNKRLPSTNSENEEEQRLAFAFQNLKKVLKKYNGMDLSEINNEEDKKIVQIIRNLDDEYGLSISLKNTLEIQNWCQKNFENTGNLKLPSAKAMDEKERRLGRSFRALKDKFKKYDNMELNEIDNEEDRKIAEIIRNLDNEYGKLGISLRNALEIQNWCQQNFENTGNMKLPSAKATDEKEKKLGSAFQSLRVKLKKYDGLELAEIDNAEDKKIAEIMRNLYAECDLRNKKITSEDIANVGVSSSTELCDKIDNTMQLALKKDNKLKQLE